MTEAARVAAGLTEAQQRVILAAKETGDGANRPTRWLCANAGRVQGKLVSAGLAYLAVPMLAWKSNRRDVVLTPLGLAVRAHLLRSEG